MNDLDKMKVFGEDDTNEAKAGSNSNEVYSEDIVYSGNFGEIVVTEEDRIENQEFFKELESQPVSLEEPSLAETICYLHKSGNSIKHISETIGEEEEDIRQFIYECKASKTYDKLAERLMGEGK